MAPLATRLALSRFLDPALFLLVALAVALVFAFRGAPRGGRRARVAVWSLWGLSWILATPFAGNRLTVLCETRGPELGPVLAGKDPAKAVMVVLAGGVRTLAPDVPPRERLDAASTQRVLTAARLFRQYRFGLVVLSGAPSVETEAMQELITSLGVPAERVVLEPTSQNTRENAARSAEILRRHEVETVVLVTSATHLRRAVKDFEAAGVHVIPAAAEIVGRSRVGVDAFLPSAGGLARTHIALHELFGYVRG